MQRMPLAALVGATILAFGGTALGEVEASRYTQDGDYHVFRDDLLNSDVRFPSGADIRVRPGPKRVMLIRPRASFVPEMLKSVEKM